MDLEEYPEGYESEVKDKKESVYSEAKKRILKIDDKYLFPYESIRNSQKELIEDIAFSLKEGKNILAHAPTGLGKTIASMGPALRYCIENKKTLFFLTSRQTQHIMGIKTLRDIKDKFNIDIEVLDLIGKKSMCLQEGIEFLGNTDFSEFCKNARKQRTCEYYNNARKKDNILKPEAQLLLEGISGNVMHTEDLIKECKNSRVCPYEIAMAKAETAQVIISDYYYVFHPNIRNLFFRKLGIELEDCVIITDEAHNLPERVKDLASSVLTTAMLDRGLSEAVKYGLDEPLAILRKLKESFSELEGGTLEHIEGEISKIVPKEDFNKILEKIGEFEHIVGSLEEAAEIVREKQKRSSIGGIAHFIIEWQGKEDGFTRIFSLSGNNKKLMYECLDPSIVSKEVFDKSLNIVVSGTLEPTSMYADLLGIENRNERSYENPFPKENALSLIVPITTTKYQRRSEEEFKRIAEECGKIINQVSGNAAFFFPSYGLRDRVYKYLFDLTDKEFIVESPSMNKEEKSQVIKDFTRSSLTGKVLLGASSGSFGEGIDLPGHFLSCVVVVGLPLKKPTLEVKELIKYYDQKFGKGWDYGYFFPSFNKTFQNIGRCIRSETDKGVMIYLDERFAERRYLKYFGNRQYKVSYAYLDKIKEFQSSNFSSSSKPSSSDVSGSMSSL